MKASELRIGNYVSVRWLTYFDEVIEITTYDFKLKNGGYAISSDLEPIHLTEEWLLKFGFHEKYKSSANRWCFDGWCIWDCEDEDGNLNHEFMYEFRTQIKYVHQLQNLYFALTNEELTYEQQK